MCLAGVTGEAQMMEGREAVGIKSRLFVNLPPGVWCVLQARRSQIVCAATLSDWPWARDAETGPAP